VSLIRCAIYTTGLINWFEEYVSAGEGLSFMVDLGWVVNANYVNQVVTMLQRYGLKSID
jgi:hypothetical protein